VSSLREKTEIRGQMSEVRRARARDRDPHPGGMAFGFDPSTIFRTYGVNKGAEIKNNIKENYDN